MRISEIRKKTKTDLMDLLYKKREDLRKNRFSVLSGKVKNIKLISGTKKDIARILTALKNK